MTQQTKFFGPQRTRRGLAIVAAVGGLAMAAIVGVALARTYTLQIAKSASVTNQAGVTKRENIITTTHGGAVYYLSGETTRHPKCTKASSCFQFWPPITVSSARRLTKQPGISGKLGTWHRNGILQATLGGHPLYRYAGDSRARAATGEGIVSFGGTWHVIRTSSSSTTNTTTSAPTTTMSTTAAATTTTTTSHTSTTSTTPCLYPPYC